MSPPCPGSLRVAARLALLEGLALVGVAVFVALGPIIRDVRDTGLTEFLAGLALIGGVVLLACGQGLRRARRVARTPVVLIQLLALPVGVGLVQGHAAGYGIPLLILAVITLAAVFAPASRAAIDRSTPG